MVTCVNLAITDLCDRSCPECCCDIPKIKKHWIISIEGLKRAANALKGIQRVTLTGGEPSMHPMFNEIVWASKELFNCKSLELSTNGRCFNGDHKILEFFDKIIVSRYDAPEFESNSLLIEKGLKNTDICSKIEVWGVHHISRLNRGTKKCPRGYFETISLYKDRVYPCCMGWGVEGFPSVELDNDWEKKVTSLELPCKICFFAEK